MKILSQIFMSLALVLGMVFAPDTEVLRPGLPLMFMALALICSAFSKGKHFSFSIIDAIILVSSAFYLWRMSTSPVADLARSDAMILLGGLMGYFWARVAEKSAIKTILITIWLLAIANLVIGINQIIHPTNSGVIYGKLPLSINTATGFYGHYIHLANYMLLTTFLGIGAAISPQFGKSFRILGGIIFLLGLVGLYYAKSRGGIVGLAVGCIVLLCSWLISIWKQKKSWAGPVTVFIVFFIPILSALGIMFAGKALENRGTFLTEAGRFGMTRMAISLASDQPITGNGSQTYSYLSFGKWKEAGMPTDYADPDFAHNEFMQMCADYGYLGLLLALAILVLIFFRTSIILALSKMDADHLARDEGLTIGALCAMVAMLTQSIFSFVFHVVSDFAIFAICAGIIVNHFAPLISSGKIVTNTKSTHSVIALVLAISSIILFWRDAYAWTKLHNFTNFLPTSTQDYMSRLERAIQIRPDFRLYRSLSEAYASAADQLARKGYFADADEMFLNAEKNYSKALERHPKEYNSILSRAMMLDRLRKFDQAEPIYVSVIPELEPRENHYRPHYLYSTHLLAYGDQLWRARKPEQALYRFKKSEEHMEKSKSLGWWFKGIDEEIAQVKAKIKFLEDARIKPSAQ